MLPIFLAFAGTALAASSSTVSLLLPGFDAQPLVASVVEEHPDSTTYAIACATPTDADKCGIVGTDTVMQGPSTWAYTIYGGGQIKELEKADCKLNSKLNVATCSVSVSEDAGKSVFRSTSIITYENYETLMLPVVVTTGPGKHQTAGPSATAASTTGTGAAPMITQNAILAGVAAVVGGALVL